jgi:hypothetical protein
VRSGPADMMRIDDLRPATQGPEGSPRERRR